MRAHLAGGRVFEQREARGVVVSKDDAAGAPAAGLRAKAHARRVCDRERESADYPHLEERIKEYVRESYAAHAYPREVEFAKELPKTLTGKIRRIELREAARARRGS